MWCTYIVLAGIRDGGIWFITSDFKLFVNPDVSVQSKNDIHATGQRVELWFTALDKNRRHAQERSISQFTKLESTGMEAHSAVSIKRLNFSLTVYDQQPVAMIHKQALTTNTSPSEKNCLICSSSASFLRLCTPPGRLTELNKRLASCLALVSTFHLFIATYTSHRVRKTSPWIHVIDE